MVLYIFPSSLGEPILRTQVDLQWQLEYNAHYADSPLIQVSIAN